MGRIHSHRVFLLKSFEQFQSLVYRKKYAINSLLFRTLNQSWKPPTDIRMYQPVERLGTILEKKSNKMVINPDDRLWISVFKWIYWSSHLLTFSKEFKCFQVHLWIYVFQNLCLPRVCTCLQWNLPSTIILSFSSWKYHYILKILEFRNLIGRTIYFLSIYTSFSLRFFLNFASIWN